MSFELFSFELLASQNSSSSLSSLSKPLMTLTSSSSSDWVPEASVAAVLSALYVNNLSHKPLLMWTDRRLFFSSFFVLLLLDKLWWKYIYWALEPSAFIAFPICTTPPSYSRLAVGFFIFLCLTLLFLAPIFSHFNIRDVLKICFDQIRVDNALFIKCFNFVIVTIFNVQFNEKLG